MVTGYRKQALVSLAGGIERAYEYRVRLGFV